MGFLSKLFSKPPARPAVGGGGGRISMYAMTLQQKFKLSSQRCGIDGRTFPCPSVRHTIVTMDINGFALDVGGYCSNCREFRCHEHVEFKKKDEMSYEIACKRCGTPVHGVEA